MKVRGGGEPPPVSLCWQEAQIDQDWVGAEISRVPKVCRGGSQVLHLLCTSPGCWGGSSLRLCFQIHQCQRQPGGSLAVLSKCDSLLRHSADLFGVGGWYLSHCGWSFGYFRQAHRLSGMLGQSCPNTLSSDLNLLEQDECGKGKSITCTEDRQGTASVLNNEIYCSECHVESWTFFRLGSQSVC